MVEVDYKLEFYGDDVVVAVEEVQWKGSNMKIVDIQLTPYDRMCLLMAYDGHGYNDEPLATVVHKFVQIGKDYVCRKQELIVKQHKSIVVGEHMMVVHGDMVMNF